MKSTGWWRGTQGDATPPPLVSFGTELIILSGLMILARTAVFTGLLIACLASPVLAKADFWCDSTDRAKLDLVVTEENGRYYMTNAAAYKPADINCYYYVNWDLQGTRDAARPIERVEVEANSLYLVHLYEIGHPRTLRDFWDDDPHKRATVAFVWVNGTTPAATTKTTATAGSGLVEVRESARWFHYRDRNRVPFYAQRFPEFRLPQGKVLSVAIARTSDTHAACRHRGITHFQSGGGDAPNLPRSQRLLTIPTGWFNIGLPTAPSGEPHISPTEMAFLQSPVAHVVKKAEVAQHYDYIFLDEEFWHNDYQPATIERLIRFTREARRINPTLKIADFWNLPPYRYSFMGGGDEQWTADARASTAAGHYGNPDAALADGGTPTLLRQVDVDGKPASLAQEMSAVSVCVYFDNLFGFVDQYDTFSNDLFIPALIHTTRINRQLPVNQGKPIIWFGMEFLEGKHGHPHIPFKTRLTKPPGTGIFNDCLPISPNLNEALSLFAMLEADGAYLWEPHGPSNGDPNSFFDVLRYCRDSGDGRGQWQPDVPNTPLGDARGWYPPRMYTAPDYYVLGAWKYAQIAEVIARGKRQDFSFSTDGGATWYTPPDNGATMPDVIRQKLPIVTGATTETEIAIVAFHPFQGVADRTPLLVRHAGQTFTIDLLGTRARVYRGQLAR